MTGTTSAAVRRRERARRTGGVGALLGMAGISALWGVVLFVLVMVMIGAVTTVFAAPIAQILGVLGSFVADPGGTRPRPAPASPSTRISVVIPCRDDAAMLAVCLAALAAQTLLPFEVIVVDNGSIDESRSVALAAGARVVAAHAGGIPNATALGLDASRGEILARLDADSRPAPDWLERVAADLCDPDGWSAVTGTGEFYGTRRLLAWAGRVLYLGGYFRAVGAMLGHPPLFGSNLALQCTTWRRMSPLVHRERTDIHDDLDLSIQLEPDMSVLYDPRLRVGVSGRQLASWPSLRRHLAWSVNTFALDREQMTLAARRRSRNRCRRRR